MAGERGSIADRCCRLLARLCGRRQAPEPLRDWGWALANIKTLGYELARLTASASLPPAPAAPPSAGLKSKPCTQADIESGWVAFWCAECGVKPVYVRKWWEFCYVAQALWDAGMLSPGRRGLGFGCGREPLPSLFAKYGCEIVASDLPAATARARKWLASQQRGADPRTMLYPTICPDPEKLAKVSFREIDMNRIPPELDGAFDFCWSCCALEHLGSLELGRQFIENSLRVLRPGGVAVHTLEFNLDEAGDTLDRGATVLFQRRHLEAVADLLASSGHRVAELDFNPGAGLLDGFIDLPPYDPEILGSAPQPLHLKVSIAGFRCTSFGLIVTRRA